MWEVTRQQYGLSTIISQSRSHFVRELVMLQTCQVYSQAMIIQVHSQWSLILIHSA